MKSRAVRFALQALFVALLAAAGYMVWQQESKSVEVANAARAFDERARARHPILPRNQIRSAWICRRRSRRRLLARASGRAVGSTREGLTSLQPQARVPQARTEIDTAIAALEDFEQMDRRAREYVRGGQRLLASDLVFSDGIEKMDAAAAAIERAQASETAARRSRDHCAPAGTAARGRGRGRARPADRVRAGAAASQ